LLCFWWRGLRARLNMANFVKIEDRECGFSKLKRWWQGYRAEARAALAVVEKLGTHALDH